MARQLDELKDLAKRLGDGPVVCGGSLPLPARGAGGVSICYSDPHGQLQPIDFPSASNDALQRLADACTPATFGRGSEEVLDPAYRQAVRLNPNQFVTSLDLAEFPILAEIRRLFGSEITDVRAQLYKLNVYATGGFFKAHRDTPRSSQLIGTLVVCLPTQFEGGEFLVKDACDDTFAHTFDWAKNPQNGLQWCAFYADSEHEVLPVTSGYRVTLTYLLEHQAVAPLGTQLDAADARVFTAFGEKLEADLKDPTFAPQGTKLGFGLKHQYIISKGGASFHQDLLQSYNLENLVALGGNATVPLLKGVDCVLKQTLDRLGLRYVLVPVYKTQTYDNWVGSTLAELDDDEYDSEDYGFDVPTPTEWQFPFRVEGKPQGEWRGDDERRLFISDWSTYLRSISEYLDEGRRDLDFGTLNLFKAREVVWVVPPTVFPYEKSSIVYGNEPELGHYFAAACLIVYVPPSARRHVGGAPP